MSSIPERIANGIVDYSKVTILVMLLLTAGIGAGAGMVSDESSLDQFETGSEAQKASRYVQENFTSDRRQNQTAIQVIQRGDNVLSKEAVIDSLKLQQEIRANETINSTLAPGRSVFGIGNVLALTQIKRKYGGQAGGQATQPTIEQQIKVLKNTPDKQYRALVKGVLAKDGNPRALALMPSDYKPGSTTAKARNMIITQQTQGGSVETQSFSEDITRAQLSIRELAQDRNQQYIVFGAALITEEIDRSFSDSFQIVGPLALLFVVIALTVAYRDLVDIILGVLGIFAVLLWTFGFMGWAGITFNQLLISVPVLLIGLSIDYAIHVFMRHREHRGDTDGPQDVRGAMQTALYGVGVALVWVTATAALGFLANLVSPIGPLKDFGLTCAFGITAALFVFGAFIPAVKVEVDALLESFGLDRDKRAFGTGGSVFGDALSVGAKAARRAPAAVIILSLLLTAGGTYGATQVDTSFQQEDFLAESPPGWMDTLPEPFKPGDYRAKKDLNFVQERFQQQGREVSIVIRPGDGGDLTSEETLKQIEEATAKSADAKATYILPNGQPDVQTPLSVMKATAAQSPRFEKALKRADTNGNGIPDQNIEQLYGQLLKANPQASGLIYRNEAGEYKALRMTIAVKGVSSSTVADSLRDVSDSIEADSSLSAVATGDLIINSDVQDALFETVIQSLLITLVSVFIFLAVAYRLSGDTASLGVVTLLPVLFSVTWILGTMWLINMPFNALTGTIAALTIGLGIAYSIHISSRYTLELERQEHVWDAMDTTIRGTGGALLGSAATTVGGFGTLALAILPVLQQFGIITGLTIIYAFLASVLVLPSMLVVWTRYIGPAEYFPTGGEDSQEGTTPAATESDD